MYTLTTVGFCDDHGGIYRHLELSGDSPANEWVNKQENSITEYINNIQIIPQDTLALYGLFDGFIATTVSGQRNLNILDVGCGIQPKYPLYVSSLHHAQNKTGNIYVGLDPISYQVDKRGYPFVCGRIEDLPAKLDSKFDVFIFATSLDHFEDIQTAATAVKSMAGKQAICIFWVGLHDPKIVAEQIGARVFSKLFQSLSPIQVLPRFFMACARMLRCYFRLLQRQSNLLNGRKLDNLHYYYFTQQKLPEYLKLFGEVQHSLRIPGTNNCFAVVKISSGAG